MPVEGKGSNAIMYDVGMGILVQHWAAMGALIYHQQIMDIVFIVFGAILFPLFMVLVVFLLLNLGRPRK